MSDTENAVSDKLTCPVILHSKERAENNSYHTNHTDSTGIYILLDKVYSKRGMANPRIP